MRSLPTRAQLCDFWDALMAEGHDPASSYMDLMALLLHDNEVPDLTLTSDGGEMVRLRALYALYILRYIV